MSFLIAMLRLRRSNHPVEHGKDVCSPWFGANDGRIRNIELKHNYWQTISVEAILVRYSNK
jgi:hypothetical protein